MYNDRPVTKVSSGELNRDSTDSKKAELALAISEEKFRAYVELSPVAVFVVNSDGKYEYVNEAASKMLGYSIEELTEKGSDMLRLGLLGTGMTKRPENGLTNAYGCS